MGSEINLRVQNYWEVETCGIGEEVTAGEEKFTAAWFRNIEESRYRLEPYIHDIARFSDHFGEQILEIGVGAGTDHLQWARAGCVCHGVDLTEAAIETTRRHLAVHGFQSDLRHLDAEKLPFDDDTFDLVYSWGVIHHSQSPETIVAEIKRVLKPGGWFTGMLYNRRSVAVWRLWVRHGLLSGRPWRSLGDIAWHHIESIGTKVYTPDELSQMFSGFNNVRTRPIRTHSDEHLIPGPMASLIPQSWGFFIAVEAEN